MGDRGGGGGGGGGGVPKTQQASSKLKGLGPEATSFQLCRHQDPSAQGDQLIVWMGCPEAVRGSGHPALGSQAAV